MITQKDDYFTMRYNLRMLCCLLTLLVTGISLNAQTPLYVDSSVVASGNGASWSTAFKTLNEALNTANAGSVTTKYIISVAKGTYYPTGSPTATNRDSCYFIGRAGIMIMGGYANGGGTRNISLNKTILSGNIGSSAVVTDNSYHLLVVAGIASPSDSVRLDGLYLTQAYGDGLGSKTFATTLVARQSGAAMSLKNVTCTVYCDSCTYLSNYTSNVGGAITIDSAVVVLKACAFTGNSSMYGGGALYTNSTAGGTGVKIDNCSFTANTSQAGGAVWNTRLNNTGTGTIFLHCSFIGNTALQSVAWTNEGGGAVCDFCPSGAGITGTGALYKDCSFAGNIAMKGGAIYSYNSAATANTDFIKGCTFTNNNANLQGGAVSIYAANTGYIIDSCGFSGNNSAGDGGAIHTSGSSWPNAGANIRRCMFNSDTAALRGGALFATGHVDCYRSQFLSCRAVRGGAVYDIAATAKHFGYNVFSGNSATLYGGALFLTGGNAGHDISNCLFSGNTAGTAGGAVCDSATSLPFIHCTFAGDSAATANGIHNMSNGYPAFANCIIWDGPSGVSSTGGSIVNMIWTLMQGGFTGSGNISKDPQFVAPLPATAAPTTGGNYQLLPCSPAINVGNNNQSGYLPGAIDLAGAPRLYGATVDMGAYEYQSTPLAINITGRSLLCLGDTAQLSTSAGAGIWTSGNGAVASVTSGGLVTSLAAGTGVIVYTLSSNGCWERKTIQVDTLNRGVTVVDSVLMAQDSTASYQWVYCDEFYTLIPGAAGRSFTAHTGNYRVILHKGGCIDTSDCLSLAGVGVAATRFADDIRVYPNPTSDVLTVKVPGGGAATLLVQDLQGRILATREITGNSCAIPVSRYAAGVYLVKYISARGQLVRRFMVVR